MPNLNKDALAALERYPEAKKFADERDPGSSEDVENERYVYEWFTKDDGKVFFVGRGVRNRYKHILWSIKKGSARGRVYKALQEQHGIEHRVVYQGLNFQESKILAYALIRQRLEEGMTLEQNLSEWLD